MGVILQGVNRIKSIGALSVRAIGAIVGPTSRCKPNQVNRSIIGAIVGPTSRCKPNQVNRSIIGAIILQCVNRIWSIGALLER